MVPCGLSVSAPESDVIFEKCEMLVLFPEAQMLGVYRFFNRKMLSESPRLFFIY